MGVLPVAFGRFLERFSARGPPNGPKSNMWEKGNLGALIGIFHRFKANWTADNWAAQSGPRGPTVRGLNVRGPIRLEPLSSSLKISRVHFWMIIGCRQQRGFDIKVFWSYFAEILCETEEVRDMKSLVRRCGQNRVGRRRHNFRKLTNFYKTLPYI